MILSESTCYGFQKSQLIYHINEFIKDVCIFRVAGENSWDFSRYNIHIPGICSLYLKFKQTQSPANDAAIGTIFIPITSLSFINISWWQLSIHYQYLIIPWPHPLASLGIFQLHPSVFFNEGRNQSRQSIFFFCHFIVCIIVTKGEFWFRLVS